MAMANDSDDNKAGSGAKARPAQMTEAERREIRRAKALRANLARRKDQARARRAGEADPREDGLPAANNTDDPVDPA